MSTFSPAQDPSHLYFVTATILGWERLFTRSGYGDIVLDSLNWHRENDHWALYAFVLMPHHLHMIIKPLHDRTISDVLQSFGSYTAHALLARLKSDGSASLLGYFGRRHNRDASKEHQIWQPIQAKSVYSAEFLREKLEYIHNNPVAKHWHLVEDRADYPYSSACYYDRDAVPVVEVDDVSVWLS